MKKHPWTFAAGTLVAALVALSVWLVAGPAGKHQEDVQFLSTPMDDRIAWPSHAAATGEYKEKCCRHYIVAADGITHLAATVQYDNGNTGYEKFRSSRNGVDNIESVTIKYPLQDGQTEPQVARELHLDADGHTFLSDRRYSLAGVLTTVGDRKGDKYTETEYTDDGMSVKRHQDFSRITTDDFTGKKTKWVVELDEQFDANHLLVAWTQRRDDGAMIVKAFAAGKIVTRTMEDKDHSLRVTEYYDVDGTTVVKKTTQEVYGVTVTVLKNNLPVTDTKFTSYDLTVTIYDEQGHPHLRQSWRPIKWGEEKTDGKYDQSKFKLSQLDYLDAEGQELKTIHFQDDGVTPDEIRIRDPKDAGKYNPSTVKKFRADGTVSEVITYSDTGTALTTETHTADEKIHETIDANDMAPRPFDQPPEPLPAPRVFFRWF